MSDRIFKPKRGKIDIKGYEMMLLYMGKGKQPHAYIRRKRRLSMAAIAQGLKAPTMPWRRILDE